MPNHIVPAPEVGKREWTDTAPWHHITDHRRPDHMPAAYVTAYETPGTDRLRLQPFAGDS